MSRRKQKKHETASPGQMEGAVRASLGHPRYGHPRPKYPTTRRLKCSACKKTWKFSDKLNYAPCPACKQGRLS